MANLSDFTSTGKVNLIGSGSPTPGLSGAFTGATYCDRDSGALWYAEAYEMGYGYIWRSDSGTRLASYIQTGLHPDVVGYYKFNSFRYNTVPDYSTYGKDGTVVGEPILADGASGNGALFPAGSYLSVPADTVPVGDFSCACWINPRGTNFTNVRFLELTYGGGSYMRLGFYLDWDKVKAYFATNATSFKILDQNDTINLSATHFVVFRVTGTEAELWINGVLKKSSTTIGGWPYYTDATQTSIKIGNGSPCVIDSVRFFKRALTNEEIALLYAEGAPPSYEITEFKHPDMLLAYSGDNISGSTVRNEADSTKNGLASGVTYSSGLFGNGMVFNGAAYVDAVGSATPLITDGNNWEICFWANGSLSGCLFSQYSGASGDGTRFQVTMTGGNIDLQSGGSGTLSASGAFASGWNFYTLSQSGSSRTITRNNEVIASGTGYGPILVWPAVIGARSDSGVSNYDQYLTSLTNFMSGTIDDFRVYNRQLTSAERTAVYSGGYAQRFQHPHLVLAYTMDNRDASFIYDSSPNSRDAALIGSTFSVGKFGDAMGPDQSTTATTSITGNPFSDNALSLSFWIDPGSLAISNSSSPIGFADASSNWLRFSRGNSNSANRWKWEASDSAGGQASYYSPSLESALSGVGFHHVALICEGNVLTCYVNGSLVFSESATVTIQFDWNQFFLGHYWSSIPDNSMLDQVRLFNRALSPTEVLELYNEVG